MSLTTMIFILARKCKARSDTASLKMKTDNNSCYSVTTATTGVALADTHTQIRKQCRKKLKSSQLHKIRFPLMWPNCRIKNHFLFSFKCKRGAVLLGGGEEENSWVTWGWIFGWGEHCSRLSWSSSQCPGCSCAPLAIHGPSACSLTLSPGSPSVNNSSYLTNGIQYCTWHMHLSRNPQSQKKDREREREN